VNQQTKPTPAIELLWGTATSDELCYTLDEAVKSALDGCDLYEYDWPLVLHRFKRMTIPDGVINLLSRRVLDYVLDELYSEFAGVDDTKPTPGMQVAAQAFVGAVVSGYRVYHCEPAGLPITEVYRCQAECILGGGAA
jgi:hypothetical protein